MSDLGNIAKLAAILGDSGESDPVVQEAIEGFATLVRGLIAEEVTEEEFLEYMLSYYRELKAVLKEEDEEGMDDNDDGE